MKKNLKAITVEDNGGGLALYIVKDDKVVWSHSCYEYNKGQLTTDMQAFCENPDPSDWEGDEGKVGQEAYHHAMKDDMNFSIVAEVLDGKIVTYPDIMGTAASLEFLK